MTDDDMLAKTTEAYTDDQKRVLKVAAEIDDPTPSEVADTLGDSTLTTEYCEEIMNNFHLPVHEHPEKSETITNGLLEESGLKERAERARPLDSLGRSAKRVVETINDNPDLTQKEVADKLDVSQPLVSTSVRRYAHLIPEDAVVYDNGHPDDVEWDDLTDDQREVIEYINDNPGATTGEVSTNTSVERSRIVPLVEMYPHHLHADAVGGFATLTEDAADAVPLPPEEVEDETETVEREVGQARYKGPAEGYDATEQYISERPRVGEVQTTEETESPEEVTEHRRDTVEVDRETFSKNTRRALAFVELVKRMEHMVDDADTEINALRHTDTTTAPQRVKRAIVESLLDEAESLLNQEENND